MRVNNYELDKYQEEAVKSNHDATVVVAGAGSGKTLTIQGKIEYLINELHYKEESILCISFTNKSVNDLKNKINYNIEILTFHKLAIKLLNNEYKLVISNYLEYITNEYLELNKKELNKLYLLNNVAKSKLINIICYYIRLSKSYNLDLKDIFEKYNKSLFNKQLYKLIMDIYLIYMRELESTKQIDFDDLLNLAKDKVKYIDLQYKYIIIDEFQDTSITRLNLILEIIKYTKAKLLVVGDDYQSIYKFNGCNLDIFLNMKNYIKDTKYIYLKYTYRFSNELIYVSTNFIMRNKQQLKKEIEAKKNISKPIKIVFNKNINELIKDDNYLVITRNNQELNNINYDNKMTIHASKGLEADNVILYYSDNLPSKIKQKEYITNIIGIDKNIMYEEERRLFYVALTRTKNNIYIMVDKKISPFVKELIHDYKNYIEIIN